MTWYPDLSPYIYLQEISQRFGLEHVPAGQVILNVGWLGSEHDFPVGNPPPGFLDTLEELCAGHAQARIRGFHTCPFCTPKDEDLGSPYAVNIFGKYYWAGNAEIRVISENGTILTAPTVVVHYVERHRYLPPAEFVEAVLARRVAEDPEA